MGLSGGVTTPVASVTEPQSRTASPRAWGFSQVLQAILMFGVWCGGMFLAAGSVRWLRGWIFTIAMLSMYAVVGVYVHLRDPGLLNARVQWSHRDTQPFDRWFIRLFAPVYMSQPIVAGLDAVRFHWSSMPFATVYLGLALLACGMAFIAWAMAVNPFAERTVRLQSERGQTTVTNGPYRIVRHPMYLGALMMFAATGLVLGSWWSIVIGLTLALLFVWRTAMEDRFLRRQLPGYQQFAATTRYRLLPGIW
jgi:protein-S-isoprenylcysteine O-methyltransferase Ste14